MTWKFLQIPKPALIEIIKLSEGTMKLEINEANSTSIDHRMSQISEYLHSTELLINEATIAVNGLEIIANELSKVPKYIELIKKNWVTTVKDPKEETPNSWTKWDSPMKLADVLRSHSEKGFIIVQSLRDLVCYVVDLSDVPKGGSFNPYGNEQMESDEVKTSMDVERNKTISTDLKSALYHLVSSNVITETEMKSFIEHARAATLEKIQSWEDVDIDSLVDSWQKGEFIFGRGDIRRILKNKPTQAKSIVDLCIEIATDLGLRRVLGPTFTPMALESHDLSAFDREGSRSEFIRALCIRWNDYCNEHPTENNSTEINRMRNRLLSTSCFPGGGKTFFLDDVSNFIASIEQDYVQSLFPFWSDDILASCTFYLRSLVILKISFNGWSSLGPGYTFDRYIYEISLRLLYSFYFTKGKATAFGEFSRRMPQFGPSVTIAQCLAWFDESLSRSANYLLLVDELEKSSVATQLCSYICQFMDQMETRFDCFFTNLNASVINGASRTLSQRSVDWVTLPVPQIDIVQKIFEAYSVPELTLIEISGHWRSIILLLEILKVAPNSSYDYLSRSLLNLLSKFMCPLTDSIVESCFSRHSYLLTDRIENTTVAELISNGHFLNPIQDLNSPIYLDFSLLFLKQWAARVGVDELIIPHLKVLFQQLFELDSSTTWSFSSYESFHCFWLAIYHYCRYFETDDRITTVSQFYPSRRKINNCLETTIKIVKIMSVEQVTLDNIKPIKFNTIYLLGKANPGFDSIIFYEACDGQTVAVVSENKFSDPTSKTVFSVAEMVKKRNLAITAITKNFEIAEDDIYFVFPIWRDAPEYMKLQDGEVIDKLSSAKCDVSALRNVIVLLRDDLRFLYGPLHRRLYFQCGVNSTYQARPNNATINLKTKGGTLESPEQKKVKVKETTEEIVVEETEAKTDETT